MVLRKLPLLIISLSISGCATLPPYRELPITTADVVRHIKCELREAVLNPENKWAREWNAGHELELQVNHYGEVGISDASWTFPLNMGATFNVALTGQVNGFGTRTETIVFNESIQKTLDTTQAGCVDEAPRRALLGGELGIADILERARRSRDDASVALKSLTYELQFEIKKVGSVTPKFNVIPIGKEKLFSGSGRWSGHYRDTQTLKITLTPPAREEAEFCPVMPDGKRWPDPSRCPQPVYLVTATGVPCKELKREAMCTARPDCMWVKAGRQGTCQIDRDGEKSMSFYRTVQPTARARSGDGSGMSPADERVLNDARGLNAVNSLRNEIRRQGIGN